MSTLAIQGHLTRGSEVIALLKMLGGRNIHDYTANCTNIAFYISESTGAIYYNWYCDIKKKGITIFTLEEFEKKFPYKVGDNVWLHYENLAIRVKETITRMRWCDKWNYVLYDVFTCCNLREYAFTPIKNKKQWKK